MEVRIVGAHERDELGVLLGRLLFRLQRLLQHLPRVLGVNDRGAVALGHGFASEVGDHLPHLLRVADRFLRLFLEQLLQGQLLEALHVSGVVRVHRRGT